MKFFIIIIRFAISLIIEMGFYLPATEYDNLYLIINSGAKFINFNISSFKNSPSILNLGLDSNSNSNFRFERSFHPGFFLACPTRLC